MKWDIFCQVIDNFGDIGVCWRLASDLVARGQQVRLWVDDPSALQWMAPSPRPSVEIIHWDQSAHASPPLLSVQPGDVVIESFGCDLPSWFVAQMHATRPPHVPQRLWLNLEYLSAEPYAEKCHRLPSPVLSGPGQGLVKHFFYPGFTRQTGGLLREADLLLRQQRFNASEWLARQGLSVEPHLPPPLRVALFCYEPPALSALSHLLRPTQRPVQLLVTAGRSATAVQRCVREVGLDSLTETLTICELPYLSQTDFDHLLWACDMNFVRGEDSLARAIWARKPFVWQIYPQSDGAHFEKLDAFLSLCQASPEERQWHDIWNGRTNQPLPPLETLKGSQMADRLWNHLCHQVDLSSQLLAYAVEKTQ